MFLLFLLDRSSFKRVKIYDSFISRDFSFQMAQTPTKKDESSSDSLVNLLKQYRTRVDQRESLWTEGTKACREQQRAQTTEIEQLKETISQLQSKTSSSSNSTKSSDDKQNLNYKSKWEESEAKCRMLEEKFRLIESDTIKPLREKVERLERDYHQMKGVKDRLIEIFSIHQTSQSQMEQLKRLVNENSSLSLPVETIANKNDFHQQTIKLRDILSTENNRLLQQIEDIVNRKRKRDQINEQSSDEEQQDQH